MKRRLKKKYYRKYVQYVLSDVSFPPEGYGKPGYRGVLREVAEFTPVLLDTSDPMLFSVETRVACQKYGLYFWVYRKGTPESCLIVVVSAEYPQIFEISYNDLTEDVPLEHYQVLTETTACGPEWGKA